MTYRRPNAILPIGSVTPNQGECKYFNIYEVYTNSTVEVWKNEDGKIRFVSTSGESMNTPGNRQEFMHDQTRRFIGMWEMVEAMPIEMFKHSSYKRAAMYCYK